jgi:SAM-dependent methyltransferase
VGMKRDIAASYGTNPAGFSRYADALVYSHLAVPLADAVREIGHTFVDIASGTGALARLLPDVVAVDLTLGQLTMNKTQRKVQADAESLPFNAGSFDVSVSAFGINHFPSPEQAVREMARVGAVIALSTWVRPERVPHAPKEIVLETIERHLGRPKTPVGAAVDRMSEDIGSEEAIRSLLESVGLNATVWIASIEVPWPGVEDFVDYRLSMMGTDGLVADLEALRVEAIEAVSSLSLKALEWHPEIVIAVAW